MTYSIESFKSDISKHGGLARSNLYRVVLPPLTEDSTHLNLMCKSSQLPGRQILTADRAIGMPISKIAYGYGVDEVRLTFHLMNDYAVRKYFDAWQKLAIDQETYEAGYFAEYSKSVVIQQIKTGISIPIYRKELGLEDVPSNILNRLPSLEIPGLGGIDFSQNEIDIALLTDDLISYSVELQNAFPTTVSPVQLADGQQNTISELSVALSFKDWRSSDDLQRSRIDGTPIGGFVQDIIDIFNIF